MLIHKSGLSKLLMVVAGVFLLSSCKKFLEEYSPTDLVPKSASDYGEILFSDGYPSGNDPFASWMALLDDDSDTYFTPVNSSDHRFITSFKDFLQWQPYLATIDAMGSDAPSSAYNISFNAWRLYYQRLLGANVVIHGIDGASGTQQQKEQYKGEAYVLRAYYHFMLVNTYARPYNDSTTTPDQSPGIPIRTSPALEDAYLQRHTVKEVYDRIKLDIDSAIFLLDRSQMPGNIFRISNVAAHLFASRVCLFMEDWDGAIAHANAVIAVRPGLMDYKDWNGLPAEVDKPLIGRLNVESIWCFGHYRENYDANLGFSRVFDISEELGSSFEDGDLRKVTAFMIIPDIVRPFVATPLQQQKVQFYSSAADNRSNSWRTSEAYLNRAEALIQKYRAGDAGAAAEALASLNTLRQHRYDANAYQPWVLQPADVLLRMCREERRRELFYEGHRWFDLRRYGMPAIRHKYYPTLGVLETYTLEKGDIQYVVPIPNEVLQRNPALLPNPQRAARRNAD